jgi:segregation and condensation protein B
LAQEVRATSGSVTTAARIGADGSFRLDLAPGQTYQLEVVRNDGSTVPLVFPRRSGVSTELHVANGASDFNFGRLRLIAPFNSQQFRVGVKSGADDGTEEDVECEDGIDALTGLPCADEDDEAESCEEGDDEENDDEEDGDTDDIECEDGIDPDGLPCDDSDDGEEDDEEDDAGSDDAGLSLDEAAVPELVPPEGLGSCDDEADGGENDEEGDNVDHED